MRAQAPAFDEIHLLAGQQDAGGWHAFSPDAAVLAGFRPRLAKPAPGEPCAAPEFRQGRGRPPFCYGHRKLVSAKLIPSPGG